MPLEEEKKIRVAVIDYDKCQPDKCNFLCERVCPINRMGKECIVTDAASGKPLISEELCTACGICPHKCPFKAISIINLTATLGAPIHRYGQNKFRLYRLLAPKPSAIVGIIGRNGIGKSTALKILSGQLHPNLGNFEREQGTIGETIGHFRGKELQQFFEQVKEGALKVSYKPQNIEGLSEIAKGRVLELLEKVDERKRLKAVVESLHISNILNRELSRLSGGELQRVAIAAAVLKDAQLYAIDEPSSYLDVRERLGMAKVMRELADEGRSVIVIEHDLAVLDYLSEYIHILFGKRGVYGVISATKTVRNGINEFLAGEIRDENLRFRQFELKFQVAPPSETKKKGVIAKYPALEKSFGGFSLNAEGGDLRESEVIGILGPNATGKTTFVKMLAGVEKPDKGELDFSLAVSYKPQYLKAEEGIAVGELLSQAKIDRDIFKTEIERRLHINELEDKMANELSGGELQKVSVAIALAREKYDLLLLDEPSAFVDVEDRLAMANAIRSVVDKRAKTAMVVDHDILFQDYVSDRLMVFEGGPGEKGKALKPMGMQQGMNRFLKGMGVTYRRDPDSGRPRANKPNSVKDKEQKKSGNYYYSFA